MARPQTEAAKYKAITWRIPEEVLGGLRAVAKEERRPLNTQLILYIEEGLARSKHHALDDRRHPAAAR